MIAVPAECDAARLALADALDQLGNTGAPPWVFDAFVSAYTTVRDCMAQVKTWNGVADVEVRHIEAQVFPWTEDDLR